MLSSVAPGPSGDPVVAALGPELGRRAPGLDWAGYLSTTGVYGDREGEWGGRELPARPLHRTRPPARGRRGRVAGSRVTAATFSRLAGIYGPGRGPFRKLREGTARRIVKPGQVFSRIHVDDIARALEASILHPRPGAVYNLCDDEPAPPQDVSCGGPRASWASRRLRKFPSRRPSSRPWRRASIRRASA